MAWEPELRVVPVAVPPESTCCAPPLTMVPLVVPPSSTFWVVPLARVTLLAVPYTFCVPEVNVRNVAVVSRVYPDRMFCVPPLMIVAVDESKLISIAPA